MSYFRRSLVLIFVLSACAFAQLRQVAVVNVPGRPGFEQLAWANGMLVMAHSRADSVDIFNPLLRRVEKQVTGLSDPRGLAVDDAGHRMFIGNFGNNTITVVDTANWTITRNIPVSAPPDTLLWVPQTKTLYACSSWNGVVAAVNPDDGTVGAALTFSGHPRDLVFDPNQRLLFVSLEDQNKIAVVADGKLVREFAPQAWQPTGMTFDAQGNRLFVAVRYAVLVLDPVNGSEIARIPAPGGVDQLWLDAPSRNLYVASSGGSVSVVELENGRYITQGELQTKVRGHALAFDPVKKLLYMAGGSEGRSQVLILRRVENPNRPVSVIAVQPGMNAEADPKIAEKKQ